MNFPVLFPRAALLGLLAVQAVLWSQTGLREGAQVAIEIPDDVPLAVVASDFGETEMESRGSALVIELAGTVRLRQLAAGALRSVTLAVEADREVGGGRAAVSVPSLNVERDGEFEIRLHLRLLRALPLAAGPHVQVTADAVLFASLAARGPDRLETVGRMRTREMEARRDRRHFLAQWNSKGRQGLVSAMQDSLRLQAARPRMEIRLAGTGPATAGPRPSGRTIQLAMLNTPGAPLVLLGGTSATEGDVSDAPTLTVRNRTGQEVRRFDIGWLVGGQDGALYSAGSAPLAGDAAVGGRTTAEIPGSGRFAFRPRGEPGVSGMGAYLRSAEMADGTVWVPTRQALEAAQLLEVVPVSAEEQRLSEMYRQRGPQAVVEELRRFAAHEADPTGQ